MMFTKGMKHSPEHHASVVTACHIHFLMESGAYKVGKPSEDRGSTCGPRKTILRIRLECPEGEETSERAAPLVSVDIWRVRAKKIPEGLLYLLMRGLGACSQVVNKVLKAGKLLRGQWNCVSVAGVGDCPDTQ